MIEPLRFAADPREERGSAAWLVAGLNGHKQPALGV